MFTGIIEAVGNLSAREQRSGDQRLHIQSSDLDFSDVKLGDSIAVSGVCLTAVELSGKGFWADVSSESLRLTTLGELALGDQVNLEKALMPTTRLGGHLVSGHVDGIGELISRTPEARSHCLRLRVPAELARYIAAKGSVCIDGVSLTVNRVHKTEFEVNIVPHTWEVTTLDEYVAGRRVNLEVDVIARYLERLLNGGENAAGGVSMDMLKRYGFS